MRSPLRDEIGGFSFDKDRLWRVTGPNFVAGFTEYNDEITGSAPILKKWCQYGHYATHVIKLFRQKGWTVEPIEDRRG